MRVIKERDDRNQPITTRERVPVKLSYTTSDLLYLSPGKFAKMVNLILRNDRQFQGVPH